MNQAEHTVDLDDDRVRMTTWKFKATDENTGEHRHEFDYIVVPVTGGRFRIVDLDGSEREMDQIPGTPYLGKAGTEHDVISAEDREIVFVEIELKR